MDSGIRLTGHVRIIVLHCGRILQEWEQPNTVVTTGKTHIGQALAGAQTAVKLSHFAVGTDNTVPSVGQTALGVEVARYAVSSFSVGTGTVTANMYLSTTRANGNTLTEVGLFNASSAGTMVARLTHTPIIKTSDVTVLYQWTLTVS